MEGVQFKPGRFTEDEYFEQLEDQEVELRTLGVTLPVTAFYEGVDLPPEAVPPQ